jgi:AraC family transcriptional regulator of adaptative response/methylated-DNA-[protein]-cysteine methyltransferase
VIPTQKTHRELVGNEESLWKAVVARDRNQDGIFFYSVASTGVYCRPSCPSRLANRANVRFHPSCEQAERAGFRPCKRCKPNEPSLRKAHAAIVAAACRRIEDAEDTPSLDTLAEASGLSTFHFHRIFKSIAGVTPKAYAAAHRQKRVRNTLQGSGSVTAAIHAAGFNSSGRFYASSNEVIGMTPSDFREGGRNAELRFAVGDCTLGAILVATTDKGIAAILLGDDPEKLVHDLEDQFPNATLTGGDGPFEKIVAKVVGFVDAPDTGLGLPLDVRGTAFQHRVWQALQKIPAGETVSYSELATRLGNPRAVRAVASACAANTIAIAIPCHRVVRTDGSLSGYRWGVERKRALLEKERKR